jgi:hypothetical protein
METLKTGAYTDFRSEINNDEIEIFNKAMEGFVGAKYEPVAVALQIVTGINYSFFCNSKGVYPDSITTPAIVEIYKPIDKLPRLINIKICNR